MSRQGSWEKRLWEDFTGGGSTVPTVALSTNNAAGDSFGRLRVSSPTTIFDSQLQYDKQPLLWDEKIVGSATSTHLPNESSVEMAVTTALGDKVIRQTKEYHRYQPGKSQFILCTFLFGASQSGTNKMVGYGDANNGIFLGQDGGGQYVLLRNNVLGTPSDARKIYASEWNLIYPDFIIDFTKTQIFVVDLEWLGVGRVRVGLNINGVTTYIHEFLNANTLDTVYMTTANLPIRYEIENTAAVAAPQSMKQICSTVVSEGGVEDTVAYPFSLELMDVSIPNGEANAKVIFAARPSLTFKSIENRSKFEPAGYEVIVEGGTVVTQVLYNPTLVGGTWSPYDATSSAIEGNATVSSYSGGVSVGSSIIASGSKQAVSPVFGKTVTSRLPFGIGIDANAPIPLALAAYATTNGVTASFTFQWEEQR